MLRIVSGMFAFVPPGPGDVRGPCPGLNALSNHGYLPHNGVGTVCIIFSEMPVVFFPSSNFHTGQTIYSCRKDW